MTVVLAYMRMACAAAALEFASEGGGGLVLVADPTRHARRDGTRGPSADILALGITGPLATLATKSEASAGIPRDRRRIGQDEHLIALDEEKKVAYLKLSADAARDAQ